MSLLVRVRAHSGPLAGLLLGVVVAFLGFGPGYLFGTSSFWEYPPTDFNSHVIGYRAYVQDAWHWPLFHTSTLEEPTGINLLYLDSLPPVAFVAKVVRGIVPGFLRTLWLNPFGAWQLLSYGLQGLFGALVVRAAGEKSRVAQVCGAAVALSMSAFVLRFYHTALSSHFLVLAALWLYLSTRGSTPLTWRRGAQWVALLVVALLVHPYLFVMVAAVFTAVVFSWLGARQLRGAGGVVVASCVAVYVVMAVSGFFGTQTIKGNAWGFGFKSTDLASFFVPQYSPFWPSRSHSLAIDMARNEAAEGWDYLGVGVLGLGLLLLVRAPRAMARTARGHVALLVVLLMMAAWAVGNRITFAQHVLVEVPMPHALDWLVGQLRSSGRFIWPITYAVALYLVVLGFRTFRSGALVCVTPIFAFAQLLDGLGNFAYVRQYVLQGEVRILDHAAFQPVLDQHRAIGLAPHFQCILWTHPQIAFAEMELQYLGAARGMTISNVRSSRSNVDCDHTRAMRLHAVPEADRLVVLFSAEVPKAEAIHYERLGLGCATFHDGYACSRHFSPGAPPAGFTVMAAGPTYEPGTKLELAKEEAMAPYLGIGWSYSEGTHRSQLGETAYLHLRMTRPLAATMRLHVAAAAPLLPSRPTGTAEIFVNDVSVGRMTFSDGGYVESDFALPESLMGATLVDVELRPGDWRSPKSLGHGTEERSIGLIVRDLTLGEP
jgi:hypothetical protein